MTNLDKVIYTARVHTTGGREGGTSRSDDGRLDIRHTVPGSSERGTNPEQLFAAGWSACFEGAMTIAARRLRIGIPPAATIDAEVDLCLSRSGYFLQARIDVRVPGMNREVAGELIAAAHATCPYSKATRDNIAVQIRLLEADQAPVTVIETQADEFGTPGAQPELLE